MTFSVLPWLDAWQSTLERVLLTPEERGSLFVEFKIDDLLRGDHAARFAAYRNAVGGSWLTPNEARALENRSPIEGGENLILQAGQGAPADAASGATTDNSE
jgi:phage portal protein BeeE